jgi:hypothetical protein
MPKRCFVICPFGDEGSEERRRSDYVFADIIEPAASAAGYTAYRTTDVPRPGEITSRIIEDIYESDLVIADVTGSNGNVLYELALRHATGKPFIHLSEDPKHIPFDIAPLNAIELGSDHIKARNQLRQQIQVIDKGEANFANPASRYYEQEQGRFAAKLWSWEIEYTVDLARQWLERQDRELQDCILLFNRDETQVPTKDWLRKGIAEYMLYKFSQGSTTTGSLYYIVSNSTRNIEEGGWANFRLAHSEPMAIEIGGSDHGTSIKLKFRQPARKVFIGSFEEEIREFYYAIDFKPQEPDGHVLAGTLYHPDYLDQTEERLTVATTRLIPESRIGM